MKYVKVALSSCSIRERIDINMYYKCWGYDHHANECKEVDKKKQCRKCGEEGHHSGESKNDAYCIKWHSAWPSRTPSEKADGGEENGQSADPREHACPRQENLERGGGRRPSKKRGGGGHFGCHQE